MLVLLAIAWPGVSTASCTRPTRVYCLLRQVSYSAASKFCFPLVLFFVSLLLTLHNFVFVFPGQLPIFSCAQSLLLLLPRHPSFFVLLLFSPVDNLIVRLSSAVTRADWLAPMFGLFGYFRLAPTLRHPACHPPDLIIAVWVRFAAAAHIITKP